jgi:cell wall-associated NlpC family hydrolase
VSDRTRRALLVLVLFLVALIAARAGGAAAATSRHGQASVRQAKVVSYARRLLGVRYTYGGTSPRSGFDCSGFTRFVFGHFGIALPHYAGAQFTLGRKVARQALRPGDLVFFDGLGHVGIYLGRGRFIHAPHSGTAVSVERLDGWYSSRFTGARRLL